MFLTPVCVACEEREAWSSSSGTVTWFLETLSSGIFAFGKKEYVEKDIRQEREKEGKRERGKEGKRERERCLVI